MRLMIASILAVALVAVAQTADAKPGKGHKGWHKHGHRHRPTVVVVQQPVQKVIVKTQPVVLVPVRQAPVRPSVSLQVQL
jgi:hypothetical protein